MPIHSPVTETLSSLNRDQLQKLLQYAIDEDPAGVIGKVFMRIDQIRDAKSEINEIPGLPDPTFGTESEATQTWDLTIHEISRGFNSACQKPVNNFPCSFDEFTIRNRLKPVNDFPCSFDESTIRNRLCYKGFIQRVIVLVQIGQ